MAIARCSVSGEGAPANVPDRRNAKRPPLWDQFEVGNMVEHHPDHRLLA